MYRNLYEQIMGDISQDEMLAQSLPKKSSLISPREKPSESANKPSPTALQKQWMEIIRNSGENASKKFQALEQQKANEPEPESVRLEQEENAEETPEEEASEKARIESIFSPDLMDQVGDEEDQDWEGEIPTYSGDNNQWVAPARQIATANGIPEDLFLRLIQQESGFNPGVTSKAGAIGLAQLMPNTAKYLNVNPYNPIQNLEGGARYLKEQYDTFGDWRLALAAYNAGPGAVKKYNGVPEYAETKNYVRSILS